jgi:16S rRNA (guanine966-N2)-methyltransferase
MPARHSDRQGRSRAAARTHAGPRELRIIGGQWRGRRLRFPAGDIRPTPDRVRETLFNWLQRHIVGAQCLDLFAGSGALGLEALSRGATRVVFVDRSRAAAQALRVTLQAWQAQGAEVHCLEAQRYLAGRAAAAAAAPAAFDIIFLDPPYAAAATLGHIGELLMRGWLRPGGLVYVEHARREPLPPLPAWHELRAGAAGEVGYHLFESSGRAGDEIERGLSRNV